VEYNDTPINVYVSDCHPHHFFKLLTPNATSILYMYGIPEFCMSMGTKNTIVPTTFEQMPLANNNSYSNLLQ